MKNIKLNYGRDSINLSLDEKNILGAIEGNEFKVSKSEDEIILDALHNPIGSPRLKELVHTGETVCLIIPDITRAWQRTDKFLYRLVEELNTGGVKDEDITIISAAGSHRKQTKEEHEKLLGKELSKRLCIIDHDSFDKENLAYVGETTYGTPVLVNRKALKCDHIVLAGGIVYHFLAGYAGGRKSILPGICSYETIMHNHSLCLKENLGEGKNPDVASSKLKGNPVHEDMMQAAAFLRPTFMFNVIAGHNGKIAAAVSGNYVEAFYEGCKIVDTMDGVTITEKAELVIATAGGFPKDINFYQSIKTILNAKEAVSEGGTIIILSQCSEGLGGNEDVQNMILNYDNLLDREKELRREYSISKDVGYIFCEIADKYNVIFVSDLDPELVKKANITVVKTLDEALQLTWNRKGKDLRTYVMTAAASTFPKMVY
ncbi:nickel-dependent lactate racemase [Clostridium sp. P21]|uniref:Nickel-dependent lactate racemase n=1 Tax=Clostridium muellerianum TaxID=2716538 RepID=A0A7Y0EIM0_9CLOT|nr:nickel-dependent lactate racemase [Clostridium muellerianum]NMM64087.1 nickel-dependent lactate racemase [Clostridium muellerianum]